MEEEVLDRVLLAPPLALPVPRGQGIGPLLVGPSQGARLLGVQDGARGGNGRAHATVPSARWNGSPMVSAA